MFAASSYTFSTPVPAMITAFNLSSTLSLVKYKLLPSAKSSVSWLDRDAIVVGVVYEYTPVEALYARSPPTPKCPRVLAAVVNRFVDPSVTLSVSISD